MPTPPPLSMNSPSTAFKFVAGDSSLDFINTVDWTEHGLRDERLTDYDALVTWSERAGVIPSDVASQLTAHNFSTQERATAVAAAWGLRRNLQQLFSRMAERQPPDENLLRTLNSHVGDALSRVELTTRGSASQGSALQWNWRGMGSEPTCMLWPVLWSATELVACEDVERLRICAGVSCGWMYLDRSRNGLRRWCEMSTCGARAKARRHYERTRGGAAL